MRFGEDGRLYALNPEYGLFGVAPGTGWKHQPQRDAHHRQGQLAVHQRRAHRRRRHLVGGDDRRAAGPPDRLEGPRLDAGLRRAVARTRTRRFCTPITQCPIIAPEYDDPRGVPISAILFGGRRKTTIPLVYEARDWVHGVFMGATLSSETTAAATGAVGVVRRDPMAMLPFIGYNAGDYFGHWIDDGQGGRRPEAAEDLLRQLVPPRRRTAASSGRATARTAGCSSGSSSASRAARPRSRRRSASCRRPESLDVDGLDMTREQLEQALRGRPRGVAGRGARRSRSGSTRSAPTRCPAMLLTELDGLKARLGA